MTNRAQTTSQSQRLTIVAVAAIFVILFVLLIIPGWRENTVNSMRERRSVYNDIGDDITMMTSSLLEMRAATRGFLITKNSTFRQEYDQALERLQQASASLRGNIALQPDGRLEIGRTNLEEQIREWRQNRLEYQMMLVETGDLAAAQSEFAQDINRQKYEELRSQITELRSAAHLHENEIREAMVRFSDQVILINSVLMVLALSAIALVSVGFYRQTRLNAALHSAELAAQNLSDALAIRLTEVQSLNARLEAGQRVVNTLPNLQLADNPLALLAQTVRDEYTIPAVFFWLHDNPQERIPASFAASVTDRLAGITYPEYLECSGVAVRTVGWGGMTLEYGSLEMSGKVLGVMAVAASPAQLHTALVRQHVSLLLENVTLFRQLKREDERLSTVFDSAPLGFVLIGVHGEVLLANGRAAMLLPQVAHGRDIAVVCAAGVYFAIGGKALRPEELPIVQALAGNSASRTEIVHEIDNERIPVRHEVMAIPHTGFLLVIEDMRQFHELERLKTDFVSMISHELRTPLAAIVGATSILQQAHTQQRDGMLATIELIKSQGNRLQSLIDDVLNLSRIESNGVTLQREAIDATVLVHKVTRRDAEWKSRCRVTMRETHELWVDVGRIEQVLANVLQNAIKYAPHSQIDIQIGPLDIPTGMLTVTVRDYGTPLSDTEYARVFDRFYQAHQHTTTGGVGLGLAICKYFVEAHGGTIRMYASPQRDGSVVQIALPVVQQAGLSRSATVSSFHALIVEDDAVLPRMIGHAFAEIHGTYEVVSTVREAYERAERSHYDVILVDLRLPDVSGLEFVRNVRDWLLTPIIMMTASGQEHDLLNALRIGVDDYVVKPFSGTEIALRVQNVMRRKRTEGTPKAQLRVGNVIAYLQTKVIDIDEKTVDVTPIEYRMFVLFAKNIGQVLTHELILADVWGDRYDQATQYLWVHISHLRRKLLAAGAVGFTIETVRGVGYRIVLQST